MKDEKMPDRLTEYTEQEISEAYTHLIWAQGLVDFVIRSGFNLNPEHKAETEGSLISIFEILRDYLKGAETIMSDLDSGHMVGTKHGGIK